MWNSPYDLQVLKTLNLKWREFKIAQVKEVFFDMPEQNCLFFCFDGASRGNLGAGGFGFIGRDWKWDIVVAITCGIGVSTNFLAEIMAVLCTGEWEIANNFLKVCFRTDSSAAIVAFQNGKLPWIAITRWNKNCNKLQWSFVHS
ncbi:uncharacterized protein LOC113359247 [Papaver somniferum]|uniref:uncharacterized protein LOC113359247 n=1 Tax=Papaver somniferum TaxID=3469 RepID=UPI000E6FE722|nr:uncharacterized protein LOC113359247 [Papaver somniferum]